MNYPYLDKLPLFPLIKNFRANTVFNAFVLAAIFQTILLSLTLSTRDFIQRYQENPQLNFWISILYIFFLTLISYTIMYLVFGFGSGMLVSS
jgi:succinate dehydrogenase hydrophobic anchor subunit